MNLKGAIQAELRGPDLENGSSVRPWLRIPRLAGAAPTLIVAAGACVSMLAQALRRNDYTGDEGFYGVTALNMLSAAGYILRPSPYPAGDFLADRDAFAHPPFNSYLYAMAMRLLGGSLLGADLMHILSFAALLFFSYKLLNGTSSAGGECLDEVSGVKRARGYFSPGAIAVFLMGASPVIFSANSLLEAEPLMTAFGVAALFLVLSGPTDSNRGRLLVAGICLGFAFALKLWLSAPFFVAVAAAIAAQTRRSGKESHAGFVGLGTIMFGALAPGGFHLLAVAVFQPQDLAFWTRNIYLGIFTGSGLSGGKLAGNGVFIDWVHPFWYYPAVIYRDHFFLVPIFLFGLPILWQRMTTGVMATERNPHCSQILGISPLHWALLGGISGLLPLSIMRVKESLYVLPSVTFIYLLAAVCLSAYLCELPRRSRRFALSRQTGMWGTLGLSLIFLISYALGLGGDKLSGPFIVAHSIVCALWLAFSWHTRRGDVSLHARLFLVACCVALIASSAYRWAGSNSKDRAIAALIAPYIRPIPPHETAFVASNYKSYQLYLYRRGCYWEELSGRALPSAVLNSGEHAKIKAFIMDSEDESNPQYAGWLEWLRENTSELTPLLNAELGQSGGHRIFIRR